MNWLALEPADQNPTKPAMLCVALSPAVGYALPFPIASCTWSSFVMPYSSSNPSVSNPRQERHAQAYGPLEQVVRPMLTTAEAAYYLNLRPQTLRVWACKEGGPIRPVRLHGRLGWPVVDICRHLRVDHPLHVARAR